MKTIIVLADGETWGVIEGSCLCIITDADYLALCDSKVSATELNPVVELMLHDATPKGVN